MSSKLQVHINSKIAAQYGQDTFFEIMAEACDFLNMTELIPMIDLQWDSKGKNSKLAQNIIYLTLGMWAATTA